MSHFSKIKTNITSLEILTKTIDQLGLKFNLFNNKNNCDQISSNRSDMNLFVYNPKDVYSSPICTFVWSGSEYSIVVDLQLWNLGMDFQYFVELISQKYAYNTIISHSLLNGFQAVKEQVKDDGSISLTLRRWSNV